MEGKFTLTIELGNAAMQEPQEAAAALRKVANLLDDDFTGGPINDENGNTVGAWAFNA